eukprot:1798441-Rhodomonas_salina.1
MTNSGGVVCWYMALACAGKWRCRVLAHGDVVCWHTSSSCGDVCWLGRQAHLQMPAFQHDFSD